MIDTLPVIVSVIIPVYNEEENIDSAYEAVCSVFRGLPKYNYEIIFTDNHSTDASFAALRRLAEADPQVRVIRFARNYGYQRSILVAYQQASGACAVQIDCDLQDPPELIPQMLDLWRAGNNVVYGIRRTLRDALATRLMRRGFYRFINALSEDELPHDAGEFRLVDATILAALRQVRDVTPYLRGMISAMGYTQIGIEYDRAERTAGKSKFPLKKMIELALDGVLNHSLIPLRVASGVGVVVGLCTLLLIFGYLVARLAFGHAWPAGFATTTMLLLMSITLNAFFLGIIGEYLGRIFLHLKRLHRPLVEVELNGRLLPAGDPPGHERRAFQVIHARPAETPVSSPPHAA